ncbi:uncharacterized protein TRAVEDRAFT_52825 [Trametes versicolor FP-101664 SS1]|uniref:uncharacterized protein n=1 Tax=Trametes versicolor (strain FP-101664) TaxID=717944 RepID=UPI0004621817|nr:uncharacterized protein TRAVEDRAFT_52825 [Trametes versicolor FP-101664 SS1]EIW53705.1 hypothetical protein TRAVEDRAFT_52825 [Trametes versicolor FP-101664 SS1]
MPVATLVQVNPASTAADPSTGIYPIPPPLPSLDSTFGAFLISTFIGLILLGITLHQAYRYARLFPNDSPWLKALVALAVLLEFTSSGLTIHVSYFYLITHYFQPQRLALSVWSISLYPVIGKLVPTAFCLAMVGDLMLTASLIRILRRKRTGFRRYVRDSQYPSDMIAFRLTPRAIDCLLSTDNMIDVLVMYAVNTGLLNGVFDLLTTVFAFASPKSTLWAVFGTAGAKLYAITLLAALHSRSTFRVHGPGEAQHNSETVFGVSLPMDSGRAKAAPCSDSNAARSLCSGQVNVHQVPIHSSSTIDGSDVIELKTISPALP